MFGDVPDPAVTKVRFGFEEASDTREGSMHCAERVRLGLADCEERVGLREEGRDAAGRVSGGRKRPTLDRL